MPTCGVTAAKLGQKNSGKKPSAGEEQAKEAALMEAIKTAHKRANDAKDAALMKEAMYEQKIMIWKQSVQAKAAIKKATLKEARNKDLLEKGPLETEEGRPPDQDLGTRATNEPIEEPPHDCNDDLQGGHLQGKLKLLLEEEEFYDALGDDDGPPGEKVKASKVEEEP